MGKLISRSGQSWQRRLRLALRWLTPGIGVKRWLLVLLIGTTFLGTGVTLSLLDIYRGAPDTPWLPLLSILALRFLTRPLRIAIFAGIGMGLILWGGWGLSRSLLRPFLRPGKPIVDAVTDYRRRERGPRIVAIGGGTGLSTLLRGLKAHTHNLTAIVTVADDGGSSGELRRHMGVLPPGDIRNCLAALSDDEELITQLFRYRFPAGAGLNGHNLGNLLITALADITGSFEEAIAESGRVLAVRGRVLPSTLHDVRLVAEVKAPEKGRTLRVRGESNIPKVGGQVERVWLEPSAPLGYPPAVQAILNADLILIGPGSLFTSILPNLLVPDIAAALRTSRALKFYICNVATQRGETDTFTCADHVKAIERHLGGPIFDLVICNSREPRNLPEGIRPVLPSPELEEHCAVYCADLVDDEQPWRHHAVRLAQVIMDLYYERTGPLSGREDTLPRESALNVYAEKGRN